MKIAVRLSERRLDILDFVSLDDLRDFVKRCNPDDGTLEEFEHDIRAWGRGSIYVNVTDEQYQKLQG